MELESIIAKEPVYLFSTEQMPSTPFKDLGEVKWFMGDSEKKYQRRSHPVFGPEDIIYRFNSHGYRCPEFEMRHSCQEDAVHVISIGCSNTFGFGLPEEKSYPHLFKELLQNDLGRPVINWNLAMSGASADYILRLLTSALPILKPDLVLLTFPPGMARREYISEDGLCFRLSHRKPTFAFHFTEPQARVICNANHELLNPYNNLLNLFKNYKACEALFQQFGVMWLFSACDTSIFKGMTNLIDADKLVEPGTVALREKYKQDPAIGLARDMGHPGVQPNQDHAEAFFARLQQVYSSSLEKLKQG